jgi:hypothetical protein
MPLAAFHDQHFDTVHKTRKVLYHRIAICGPETVFRVDTVADNKFCVELHQLPKC